MRLRAAIMWMCVLGRCLAAGAEPPASDLTHTAIAPERLMDALRGRPAGRDAAPQTSAWLALRRVKDPALVPLFAKVAGSTLPGQHQHGMLGFAELAGGKGLDLLLLRKIERPSDRAAVIHAAMDLRVVTPNQAEDLARWQDLDPATIVAVAAYLRDHGRAYPESRARDLSLSADPGLAIGGALALALCSATDREGLSIVERRTRDLFRNEQRATLLGLIEACRRGDVQAARALCTEVLSRVHGDPLLRDEAARLMLRLRPGDRIAGQQVKAGLSSGQDLGQRLRAALTVLETAAVHSRPLPGYNDPDRDRPSDAFTDLMTGDADALVQAIGRAARALAETPATAAGPLSALIAMGHGPSIERLLECEGRLPTQARLAMLCAAVNAAKVGEGGEFQEWALVAADRLARLDTNELGLLIESACIDGRPEVAAAGLIGAWRSGLPKAAALAGRMAMEGMGAWPEGVCRDVAALVRASAAVRSEAAVTPDLAARLGAAATTEGRLPWSLRPAAAWLALRGQGQDRGIMARMLTDPLP